MSLDGGTCTRDQVIAEVYAAFGGVTRDGGISWSESAVIDDYGDDDERAAARACDRDQCWTELVDDSSWNPDRGVGGYSFLDAIGFRYYLAPAMIRSLRTSEDYGNTSSHLTLDPRDSKFHEWTKDKWTCLTDRQRRCIREYLRFMLAHCCEGREYNQEMESLIRSMWQEPLDTFWNDL